MCRVSLFSQGTPSLTGAKTWALISIWICSPRQGSFSSCQHYPAHRFQFLKWSIISFYLFAARSHSGVWSCCCFLSLAAVHLAQCNESMLVCSLFVAGVIVFVSESILVSFDAYKAVCYVELLNKCLLDIKLTELYCCFLGTNNLLFAPVVCWTLEAHLVLK